MTSREHRFRVQSRQKARRIWLGLLVFIPVALLWVDQTVHSTKILYQIRGLEEKIKFEEDRRMELNILEDRMTSLEFVEWTAKNKLGFIVPKRENIVVLSVEDNNPT